MPMPNLPALVARVPESYVHSALKAAKTRAYRAVVSAGLSPADRDDLHQEVILDLLKRASQFDPSRASAGTFTGVVSAHRTADFLKHLKRDSSHLSFCSGDAANDSESGDLDVLAVTESIVPQWGEVTNGFDALHFARDLDQALSRMDDEQRALFALLIEHQDIPSACEVSGVSSATFYRRVAELRMHLRMFGIKAATCPPHVDLPEKNRLLPR